MIEFLELYLSVVMFISIVSGNFYIIWHIFLISQIIYFLLLEFSFTLIHSLNTLFIPQGSTQMLLFL
jgi:hypothetical protein